MRPKCLKHQAVIIRLLHSQNKNLNQDPHETLGFSGARLTWIVEETVFAYWFNFQQWKMSLAQKNYEPLK